MSYKNINNEKSRCTSSNTNIALFVAETQKVFLEYLLIHSQAYQWQPEYAFLYFYDIVLDSRVYKRIIG